jgi:hypothetical protein
MVKRTVLPAGRKIKYNVVEYVLGPLLFSIYSNSISSEIIHSKFHLYADDLQTYIHFKKHSLDETVELVNSDIMKITSCASNYWFRQANKLFGVKCYSQTKIKQFIY